MRKTTKTTIALMVAAAFLTVAGTGCTKLRARDQLNKGVRAFKLAKYEESVDYFRAATDLDPDFPTARTYLAMAYMSQYIPGAESPENLQKWQQAHDEFMKVLEQKPNDPIAMAYIATLYYHHKQMTEAEEWYRKLVAVDPQNKEAYYTLGVIAWGKSFEKRMSARADMNMKPEDPGPLKDAKKREALSTEMLPVIDKGIEDLNHAIEIDPKYADAMAYLNLLNREKADLEPTKEAYEKDIQMAEDWVQKTMDTKKILQEEMLKASPAGIVQDTQ